MSIFKHDIKEINKKIELLELTKDKFIELYRNGVFNTYKSLGLCSAFYEVCNASPDSVKEYDVNLKVWFKACLLEYKTVVMNQSDFYDRQNEQTPERLYYFWDRNDVKSRINCLNFLINHFKQRKR